MPVSPLRIFEKAADDQIGSTVAFTPSGQLLFATKNQVVEANVATGSPGRKFTAEKAPIVCFALAPVSRHLAALANDGTVFLWDAATGRRLHGFPLRDGNDDKEAYRDYTLAISPNGRYLAVSSGIVEVVRLYDTVTGRMVKFFYYLATAVFSPDGKTLFLGGARRLQAWDVRTWRPRHLRRLEDFITDPTFTIIDCAPDGTQIAGGFVYGRSFHSELAVVEAGTLGDVWDKGVGSSGEFNVSVSRVVYAPSGNRIAVGLDSRKNQDRHLAYLSLWNAKDGKAAGDYPVHRTVRSIAFSRDEKQLAALTDCVTVWPVISSLS